MSKSPDRPLLPPELERSGVVANSTMNRQRGLAGVNSYEADLRMNPLAWLAQRRSAGKRQTWLDLCCGSGRALVEAARQSGQAGWASELKIVGVDLVAMFEIPAERLANLSLVAASLHVWSPEAPCDLITCVHGWHYVGDKLGLLARAVRWLAGGGLFIANLDLDNLRLADGRPLARRLLPRLRAAGFTWDARRHLLHCTGPKALELPFRYLGADDQAGPNYTGQPAVNSFYEASV